MKKVIMLAGLVAAVVGARKLLSGKKDDEAASFEAVIETPPNGYAPQPQQ